MWFIQIWRIKRNLGNPSFLVKVCDFAVQKGVFFFVFSADGW